MAAIEGWMEPPDAVATVSLAVGSVLEGDSSAPTLAAPLPPATGLRSAAPGLLGSGANYGLLLLEDSGP